MKNFLFAVLILIILGLGAYAYTHRSLAPQASNPEPVATTTNATASTTPEQSPVTTIGSSVQGRDILAYHFGTGAKEILLVAGIHGGYEWNTSLLANGLIDYITAHPEAVPAGTTVTIIPVLNPDGLQMVVGTTSRFTAANVSSSQSTQTAGRFNGNTVDLNRNFDCDWQAKGTWQNKSVSGGTAAFSEPESQALRAYVEAHTPAAVVAYFSSAGGVYASDCHTGILPETKMLTDLYAKASGYPAHQTFDSYETTGDMTNWLAKQGTPAISVLLTNHTDAEQDKNVAGLLAVLAHYAQ